MGIGTVIVIAIVLMAALVVWRIVATIRGTHRVFKDVFDLVTPVAARIDQGQQVDAAEIRRLAADPVTRNPLYQALAAVKRTDVFPAEFRTPEAVAESDLVYWLRHPNELGSSPDEIQLISRFTRQAPGHGDVIYFLYRFRMHEPHASAKDGWMAGVAGAYQEENGELKTCLPGTLSQFQSYESKSPDAHVDEIHKLILHKTS